MTEFRPVVLESPLAGDVARNRRYLDACILDCLRRGETPYPSHKVLPGALDDLVPCEREFGIRAGFSMADWLSLLGAPRAFYLDLGMSSGMRSGREHAHSIRQRVAYRLVPGWWER